MRHLSRNDEVHGYSEALFSTYRDIGTVQHDDMPADTVTACMFWGFWASSTTR